MGIKSGHQTKVNIYSKKDLEHKLHIQHRNTRHDAIDIILAYQSEIDTFNDNFWRRECCKPVVIDPGGCIIQEATADQYKYEMGKKKFDTNELTRRIHNIKQRKPKDGE